MIGHEAAETLALQVLGWLAGQDELFDAFLGASGLGRDDLRARLGEPEVLGAVLDFLLSDDAFVTGFARDAGIAADLPLRARAALPGGADYHWT